MAKIARIRGIGWLSALAITALFAGCGTDDYNALLNKQLDSLRAGAPFRVLWGPNTIPGTPIHLRIPMIFDKSYVEGSPHKEDPGGRVRDDRIQPPFMKLPGFRMCYEGKGQDPQIGKLPYLCYLCVVETAEGGGAKIAADLLDQLKAAFPPPAQPIPEGGPGSIVFDPENGWKNIDAYTPNGKAMTWKKVRVTSDQMFVFFRGQYNQGVPITAEKFPAIFELWLYEAPNYVILIGWRAPKSIVGAASTQVNPALPAEAVFLQGPAGDKVDLDSLPILTAGTLTIDPAPAAGAAPAGG